MSLFMHSNPDRPAILGGTPVFPIRLPLVRPSVPDPDRVANDVRTILSSGVLTNGPFVRELEHRAADYFGVRHCVAVASCTAGLMLVLRASDLGGDVIVPSFTFAATAHAVVWNGLRPVFCDIDPHTLTLSAAAAQKAIGARTSAILATHTYGTPCQLESLGALARQTGIHLFFDAAHAFGSRHLGTAIGGFGDAEVFSLTPTKVVVAGEGGIIATNDSELASRCWIGRDYGNPGNYDCRFVGLNARMSEIHAAIALASLEDLDARIERRNVLARLYRDALAGIEGIDLPTVPEGDRSTYKDFTVLVDADRFGVTAASLASALSAEGIETRRYYAPPVHAMEAYRFLAGRNGSLKTTEDASSRVLTLPLWTGMADDDVPRVVEAMARIQASPEARQLLRDGRRVIMLDDAAHHDRRVG
ncbi:MAG: DegT/DnrJ/EryC1/StrS family aminotransferase [Actinomycetota bacterium]